MQRTPQFSTTLFALSLGLAVACNSGGSSGEGDASTSEAGSEVGTSASEAGTAETSGEATGEEGGTGSSLAHDITIDLVEITQGVAVPIGNAEGWVGAAGRNTAVIPGRDALMRVYWLYDDATWVPREIEARLLLTYGDGREVMRSQTLLIDRAASPNFIDRAFYFDILGEDMSPDLKYQVEFHEVDPGYFGDEPVPAPIVPPTGPEVVGVEAGQADMKVVVVPLIAAWSGCSASPDTSDATMQRYEDALYERNPIANIEFTVTAPQTIDWQPSSLWEMMQVLQQVREAEGAPANAYYYGLLNACGAGDINGAGGMAFDIVGDGMELGYARVSTGLQMSQSNESFNLTTFAHEIGHTQGSYHIACDGDPNPPPPTETAFPHAEGSVGAWGFGLRTFGLHNPAIARDYMSYCYGNSWISDWNWTRFYSRAMTLTSWDQGDVHSPEPGKVLIGVIDGDVERWWVTSGGVPEGESTDAVVELNGTKLRTTRAHLSESDAEVFVAQLPEGWAADASELTFVQGLARHEIEIQAR